MKKGNLTFIGLGLNDEKDISLKGLNLIKKSDKIFAEFYTSKLFGTNIEKLEKLFEKKIEILDRIETEKAEKIIESAKDKKVVFLTCGDSMTATTHVDIRIQAIKKGIKTRVIHGSSIVTAVPGLLGLQNYKFGRTTSLVFPEKNYFPTSPYDVIKQNKKMGLHTLVLLDIQADKKRYMTANEGIEFLLKMEEIKNDKLFFDDSILCVVARAGSKNPIVDAGSIKRLIKKDFGPPLHTVVIPGKLHFIEQESLRVISKLSEK